MTKKERIKLDRYYLKKYNITWNERMVMWRQQKGRCALCNKHERQFARRLAVEHSHKTKKVRSLACFYCNKFRIGRLDLLWAKKLVEYFEKYENNLQVP